MPLLLILALSLSFGDSVLMHAMFADGTELEERVARSVCEQMNEATGDQLVFVYYPDTKRLKQVVLVICRGENDSE